jgi:hypothetical protein
MRFLRSLNLGVVTAAWGLLFAVVHVYWAAGGAVGMNGDPADTPGAQAYVAFIAVLGLAGAAVAYGLRRERAPRPLRLLARAGAGGLLLGVVFGTGRWVADGTLGDDGAAGVAITLYFLLGGMLFSALGWRSLRPSEAHANIRSHALAIADRRG